MTQAPDLSEFLSLSKPRTPPCIIGSLLANLTQEERDTFQAACATDVNVITNVALAKWLALRTGTDVNWASARSHRTGVCRCA